MIYAYFYKLVFPQTFHSTYMYMYVDTALTDNLDVLIDDNVVKICHWALYLWSLCAHYPMKRLNK